MGMYVRLDGSSWGSNYKSQETHESLVCSSGNSWSYQIHSGGLRSLFCTYMLPLLPRLILSLSSTYLHNQWQQRNR